MQAVTDRRDRLTSLRRRARVNFNRVRRMEVRGGLATPSQAAEFLDAVLAGYCNNVSTWSIIFLLCITNGRLLILFNPGQNTEFASMYLSKH